MGPRGPWSWHRGPLQVSGGPRAMVGVLAGVMPTVDAMANPAAFRYRYLLGVWLGTGARGYTLTLALPRAWSLRFWPGRAGCVTHRRLAVTTELVAGAHLWLGALYTRARVGPLHWLVDVGLGPLHATVYRWRVPADACLVRVDAITPGDEGAA